MKRKIQLVLLFISSLRLIPHLIIFNLHKERKVVQLDIRRWMQVFGKTENDQVAFLRLMTFYPEFRNVFYYRIGFVSHLLNLFCKRMSTLFIICDKIGPGLFIQHGFSTIIAAKSIGRDCWINQQVTIGYSDETNQPSLGDNVVVHAGAKVIGNVQIGSNSKVGANAVVVKSVPPNCTVVGVPAYIVKQEGIRIKKNSI